YAKNVENTDDADADPTNELELPAQVGTEGGMFLQADGLGGVSYVSVPNTEQDGDPTNELLTGAALNGMNLELTDAGGTMTVDLSTLIVDADTDPTNEIELPEQVTEDAGSVLTADGSGGVSYTAIDVDD